MLVTLEEILGIAQKQNCAVGAFNTPNLECLIAETSVWASPDVCKQLKDKTGNIVWFPNTRRGKSGEKKGSCINGIQIDDNTSANNAIKYAIGINRKEIKNYHTCHIWPKTCYNERYHTAIPNLVLIPSAIAGLSDHSDEVKKTLQYRSFELYGWHSEKEPQPVKPKNYPTNWQPILSPSKGGITKLALKKQESENIQEIEFDSYPQYEYEKAQKEIERITRKVPIWLSDKGSEQCNSMILVAFFELLGKNDCVSKRTLKERCNSNALFKWEFDKNFPQMTSFGKKANGKVFKCDKDKVRLWERTAKFVTECYAKFAKK